MGSRELQDAGGIRFDVILESTWEVLYSCAADTEVFRKVEAKCEVTS